MTDDWVTRYQQIMAALQREFKVDTRFYFKTEDFNRELFPIPPDKCLFIWGDAGTGKTEFAKAHFTKPLIVRHTDTIGRFNPQEYDGIVFDDLVLTKWNPQTAIHLLDILNDSYINIKYGSALIPAGTPRIFTANDENALIPEGCSDGVESAIRRRYVTLHVSAPLFNKTKRISFEKTSLSKKRPISLDVSGDEETPVAGPSAKKQMVLYVPPKAPMKVCTKCYEAKNDCTLINNEFICKTCQ